MNEEVKSDDSMIVSGVKAEAFIAFLHYIYQDVIAVTKDTISDLMEICNKYQNDEIKDACEKKLIANLTEDNALDFFCKAHRFKFTGDLKKISFGMLEEMIKVRYSGQLPKEAIDLPEKVMEIYKRLMDTLEDMKGLHLCAEAEKQSSADESVSNNSTEQNSEVTAEEKSI